MAGSGCGAPKVSPGRAVALRRRGGPEVARRWWGVVVLRLRSGSAAPAALDLDVVGPHIATVAADVVPEQRLIETRVVESLIVPALLREHDRFMRPGVAPLLPAGWGHAVVKRLPLG